MRKQKFRLAVTTLFVFSVMVFMLIVGSSLALAQSVLTPFGSRPDVVETPDDVLASVADEIPGFGGMFLDNGELFVYMRGPAEAEDIDRVLDHPRLQSKLQLNAADFRRPGGPGVTALPATYDFRELHAWRLQIRSELFDLPGVGMVDVDERHNRLTLGINPELNADPEGLRARVQAQLDEMGIPADAVEIVDFKIVLNSHTVQDAFNPVPGGVEIGIPSGTCTMTVNTFGGSSNNLFMTAGHCAGTIGVNQGTTFRQPNSGPQLGFEFFDASPHSSNPPGIPGPGSCDPGNSCRFSDAVLGKYSGSLAPELGQKIANTFDSDITINPSNPRWTITSKLLWPLAGTAVKKVGRTTGKTSGQVIATCVDIAASSYPHPMIGDEMSCQYSASYVAAGGDSGAPVFVKLFATTVQLAGIHAGLVCSGSSCVSRFSALGGIEGDFGPLVLN